MSAQDPIKPVAGRFQELTIEGADRDEKMSSADLVPIIYQDQARVPTYSSREIEEFTGPVLDLSKSIDFAELSIFEKQALFQQLAAKKTLTSLSLRATGLTTEDAQLLAKCLNGNTTLKELNVSYNEITSTGALALLSAKTEVYTYSLTCTFLDDDFAKKLPHDGKSFKADLVQNFFSNDGAKLLIENPRAKDSLVTLLCGNKITDEAVINKIYGVCEVYVDEDDSSLGSSFQ